MQMSTLVLSLCLFLLLGTCPASGAVILQDAATVEEAVQTSPTPGAATTPDLHPPQKNCSKNDTTARSFSEKKQAMIDAIRSQIMLKLNLQEPPSPRQHGDIDASIISEYHAQVQALEKTEREAPQDCQGGGGSTHFSRHLKLYYPGVFMSEDPPLDHFQLESMVVEHDSIGDDGKGLEVKDTAPSSGKKGSKDDEPTVKSPSISPVLYNLKFDDLDFSDYNRIFSIQLQLYQRKITSHSDSVSAMRRGMNPIETVNVYQVLRAPSKRYILLASEAVRSEDDGYVSFNISAGIKRWLERSPGDTSLELDVHIDTPELVDTGKFLPPVVEFDIPSGKGEHGARLYVERLNERERLPGPDSLRRRKRETVEGVNSQYCFDHPEESKCCIRPLTINFQEDLGPEFDFVLYPPSFTPNYCNGECSSVWPSATESTQFLMQLRESNPTAAPEPCCVPHRTRPLFVLIKIGDESSVQEIPNMITDSCICR